MDRRLELDDILKTISTNLYFQPPANLKMKYPCIVYARNGSDAQHGNNNPYVVTRRYSVTIIDSDPDSIMIDEVAALSSATFERHFKADDLNHDIYNLYF